MTTKTTGKKNRAPRKTREKLDEHLAQFLEDAGYSEDDVLAYNRSTRRVSMKNGGLYGIRPGKILHFSGPSPDPTERV